MTQQVSQDTSDKKQELINLLLEEYKSLRDEIKTRITNRLQMVGLAGAIASLLVAASGKPKAWHLVIAGILLVGAFFFWRQGNRWAMIAALHVSQLEQRMNKLAADTYKSGEVPFTWETKQKQRRQEISGWPEWGEWIAGWGHLPRSLREAIRKPLP